MSKYFDELSSDDRLLDAEQHFKMQIYFRKVDLIIEQLKHRINSMDQILKLFVSIM